MPNKNRPVTDQEAGLEPPYHRRSLFQQPTNHIGWKLRVGLFLLGMLLGAVSFMAYLVCSVVH